MSARAAEYTHIRRAALLLFLIAGPYVHGAFTASDEDIRKVENGAAPSFLSELEREKEIGKRTSLKLPKRREIRGTLLSKAVKNNRPLQSSPSPGENSQNKNPGRQKAPKERNSWQFVLFLTVVVLSAGLLWAFRKKSSY